MGLMICNSFAIVFGAELVLGSQKIAGNQTSRAGVGLGCVFIMNKTLTNMNITLSISL